MTTQTELAEQIERAICIILDEPDHPDCAGEHILLDADRQMIVTALRTASAPGEAERRAIDKLRTALHEIALAYERRVRSECTPEQIEKEPWRCAEYIEAIRLSSKLATLPDNEWFREKIKNDPDIECDAGPSLSGDGQ